MPEHWLLIVAGAATAGFAQGLSGFGFSLVSLSFWAWALPPQQAAVLATAGGLCGQCLAAVTVRRGTHWSLLWPYLAGGLLGLPLGVLLLRLADPTGFRLFVGALLAVWCPVMLMSARLPRLRFGGRWADGVAGAAGGVMGPLGGFTGALPTLWCTLRGLDRDEQRSLIQNFNLVMLGVTTGVYVQQGLLPASLLPQLGLVLVSLLLPALVGMRVYTGISALAFRQVVMSLLTASGLALLASTLPRLLR